MQLDKNLIYNEGEKDLILRAIIVLKKNPVITLFHIVNLGIIFITIFLLYPENINPFYYTSTSDEHVSIEVIDAARQKTELILFIFFVWEINFTAGIGNMIAKAVKSGTATAKYFLQGIKKYIIKILIISLLLTIIYIGINFVIFVFCVPLESIWRLFAWTICHKFPSFMNVLIWLSMPSYQTVLLILTIPFFLLWIPSIFIDHSGVMSGFKKGFRTGVKNYRKLLVIVFMISLPVLVNIIVNYIIDFTLGNAIVYFIIAIMLIFVVPILFMIYYDTRDKIQSNYTHDD